jgi:hypothetical protein
MQKWSYMNCLGFAMPFLLTRMKKIENEEKNDEDEDEYYEEGENEEKGDVEQNRNKY